MDKKLELNPKSYAGYFFIPLFFLAIPFYVFKVGSVGTSYFFLGYLWNTCLLSPFIKSKAEEKRYRISFIVLIYKAYLICKNWLNLPENSVSTAVLRSIFPVIFAFLVFDLASFNWALLWVLVGSVTYEVYAELVNLWRQYKRLREN